MVVEEEHARELPRGGEVGEIDGRAAALGDGDEGAEGRVELRQRGEVRRGGGVPVPRVDGRRFRAVSPPLPSAAHRDWWRVPDAGEERARGSERRSR
jgi:hypothetical protein